MAFNKKNKNLNEELQAFINEGIDVFEPNYQSKFLKVFIEDRNNWAQQISDIIFPEYFEGYHKILIDYEMEYFKKYRVAADYDELKEMVNDKERDEILKDHIYGLIEKVRTLELEHQKRDSVKERAYRYFKSQNMKNTLIELALDYKKNTFDTMKVKLEAALKAGEPKDYGHNYALDVEKRLKKDFRIPISILPGLDKFIGGGPAGGELYVVMAPTGGGKSMMLVRNAVAALLAGKKVVYYTLELSEIIVGQRFDACLNNIPIKNVVDFKETIIETAKDLKINLIIKQFPDGVATVNTLYSHLDWLKCNENFIPDVIIVDYADNMKPLQKGEQLRHDLVEIYKELRAMAIEHGVPVLTASQTSGDGYAKKELSLGMTAESKGKNNIADLVLGFGRDPEQERTNRASLKILKNRNGPIGKLFNLIFDASVLNIEIEGEEDYTPTEKKVIAGAGADYRQRKKNDSVNTAKIMNTQTQLLHNQEFTQEIKDE